MFDLFVVLVSPRVLFVPCLIVIHDSRSVVVVRGEGVFSSRNLIDNVQITVFVLAV